MKKIPFIFYALSNGQLWNRNNVKTILQIFYFQFYIDLIEVIILMQKTPQFKIQNCLLSFYDDGQLHSCKIFFYENNLLTIEKNLEKNDQTIFKLFSDKIPISDEPIGFKLKINVSLAYMVTLKKINAQKQSLPKIQILIHNKQTNQKLRIYTSKTTQNFIRLYNYFKKRTWLRGFDKFFSIDSMLKHPSQRLKAQYFIVQEKMTLKRKMMRRCLKQTFKVDTFQRITNQIQIQNTLNSQNITKFQSFFQDNQFAPQKNLKQFIKQLQLSSKSSKPYEKIILKQLLQIALEMQIKGVVHNNIQLNTIQLIRQNQNYWKCCLNHFDYAINLNQVNKQVQNVFNLNYGYTAPQIINPKLGRISNKSDIFSIGVVFYYILFGKQLFKLPKQLNHIYSSYPQVNYESEEMKNLPFECLQLLQKMLQFNPDRRISVVQAMTHRYFTSSPQSRQKFYFSMIRQPQQKGTKRNQSELLKTTDLTFSIKKQNSQKDQYQHFSYTAKQTLNKSRFAQTIKQNLNYQGKQYLNKSHFAQWKKDKKSKHRKRNRDNNRVGETILQGQIDPEQIDDSHIQLQPRNLKMTPSYQNKKIMKLKFFTV